MNIERASILLKLLGDKSRLTIIDLLSKNKKMCGVDLLKFLKCKQATLSHHMKELISVDLVHQRKSGNKIYYMLNKETLLSLINFLYPIKILPTSFFEVVKNNNDDLKISNEPKSSDKKDIEVFLL